MKKEEIERRIEKLECKMLNSYQRCKSKSHREYVRAECETEIRKLKKMIGQD